MKGEIALEIEKITSLEQLTGEQKELAETIGLEAYKKLVANYAGCPLYINKPERITKQIRDAEICRKFNGSNYRQLAKEYRLSVSAVRKIILAANEKNSVKNSTSKL